MNKSNWKWTHIDIFQDPEGSRLLYTISGDYFSVNPDSGEITLIKVCSGIFPSDYKKNSNGLQMCSYIGNIITIFIIFTIFAIFRIFISAFPGA